MQVGSSGDVVEIGTAPVKPALSTLSVASMPRGTQRPVKPLS